MKKYIENLLLLCVAAFTLTACSEDEGTNPGGDGNPMVTLYQYAPSQPYNADNDVTLRFATNNKVEAVYYLSEPEADYNTHISEMGEAGYNDYVVENGTQVEGIEGQSNVDVTLTDMMGTYYITAVAVSGNQKKAYTTTFTGLAWEDVVSGTYIFNAQPVSGQHARPTGTGRERHLPVLPRARDGHTLLHQVDGWQQLSTLRDGHRLLAGRRELRHRRRLRERHV